MSFLYPRMIAVYRPAAQAGVGQGAYSGLSPTNETKVIESIPASIQLSTAGKSNPAGLPSDVEVSNYKVFSRQLARGVVQDRDVVVDDLGWRYKVLAAYWDSLGANLYCKRLEV